MRGWNSIHRALGMTCVALALCALLAGCETPLERAWGISQHSHMAQTIANPEAGLRSREAPHPDGVSTNNALTKFRKNEVTIEKIEEPAVMEVGSGG